MAIRINNLVLGIDEDKDALRIKAGKKLRLDQKNIKSFKILKESIDARKKNDIKFIYSVEICTEKEQKLVARINNKNIQVEKNKKHDKLVCGHEEMQHRPIIVGMGPAGMFAGLLMAQKGYRPIIIERGQKVEERSKTVEKFWKTGEFNLESNVQFGEGGAGTFSDGKLTTRIKDPRCEYILNEFVNFGAPEEIKYMAKPHIGTDILKNVVKNIREEIIKLGGEIRFDSKLEDIIVNDNKIKSIIVNEEEIPCENLVLAIGHSSRDTYEMLYKNKIPMEAKAFAIGVRIEHLQSMIDQNQYGKYANHPRLKASDYRLTHKASNNRGVYSFCMCPGGKVVAAASEKGRLVTNGMSYYSRAEKNANSAIVVTVSPEDFKGDTCLKGMEFQRHYEELAFKVGGSNYNAPVQLVGDFLKDKTSTKLGKVKPSYAPGYEFKNLAECLPSYVVEALKEGIVAFDKKIKGFADDDAVMTGVETRTSAPVKISRNDNLESVSVKGLYPAGEGAGFAGGIISAAVDGLKCVESIIREFMPCDK